MLATIGVSLNDQMIKAQEKTPLYDALCNYANSDVTSFDVPGHKRGLGHPMQQTLGQMTLKMDANSMQELDLLSHPSSVIAEAQSLAAEAFRVDHAYFLVNGTTVGILAMILATCKPGEQLIVPRNCHKSVMNGILLSGALPVFIQPEIDHRFGIAHSITYNQIEQALVENPKAKVVFITYPTYFGAMNELKAICELVHSYGATVIVDSAHGAHLSVMDEMDAIEAGADIITVSMHKTGGSLTQSSLLLLQGERVAATKLQKVLNMLQTTSASYLLMSSLDVARREFALFGRERFEELKPKVLKMITLIEEDTQYEVLKPSYLQQAFGQNFDWTKLVVRVNQLGLTGFEVYTLLKEEYNVQAELAEGYVVMFVISYADNEETLAKLVAALKDIEYRFAKPFPLQFEMVVNDGVNQLAMSPQQATYADQQDVELSAAIGKISAETVMIYPPGIPLIIPGEVITPKILELYDFYNRNIGNVLVENGCINKLTVVKEEDK